MNTDKIEVYKDKKLLELTQRMAMLSQEEVELLLSNVEVTSKGRTREDVAREMIIAYEETNTHLKSHYPDNTVAASWIGTNQFSANLLKERISDSDPHTSF
jgi:hypothetical protein